MVPRRWVAAALAMAALLTGGRAYAMPDVPVPPGSTLALMGDELVVNGLPARMREVRAPIPPAALLDFYRARLRRSADAPPLRGDGVEIVGGFMGASHVTVIAQDDSGKPQRSLARILQTDLSRPPMRDFQTGAPTGSVIHSQIDSRDGERMSSVVLFSNSHSIETNVEFLVDKLKGTLRMGVTESHALPAQGDAHPGRMVWLSNHRGADAVISVQTRADRRIVMVHTMSTLPAASR